MSIDKWKQVLSKYLIELLIVAFGVFLGIYVSEWKSNNRLKNNTEKSFNYILMEIESNQKSLENSIQYHELIKSNFGKTISKIDKSEVDKPYYGNKSFHVSRIENWNGVGLPNFETVSFEVAKINNVLHELDFDVVQQIARAYQQIETNQEFGNSVLKKLLETNSETKIADIIGIVEMMTSDVLISEKNLNTVLLDTIKYLNDYKARH